MQRNAARCARRSARVLSLVAPAALLAGAAGAGSRPPPSGWLTYGADVGRGGSVAAPAVPAAARLIWSRKLAGRITAQPLVVDDVPAPGRRTVYAATSAGRVVALDGRPCALGAALPAARAHVPDAGRVGRDRHAGCRPASRAPARRRRVRPPARARAPRRQGAPGLAAPSLSRFPRASSCGARSRSSATPPTSPRVRTATARWRARSFGSASPTASGRRGRRCPPRSAGAAGSGAGAAWRTRARPTSCSSRPGTRSAAGATSARRSASPRATASSWWG